MSDQKTFDPTQVRVWNIDDMEWWIGRGAADDIWAAVADEYGYENADRGDGYPQPEPDDMLDKLKYVIDDVTSVSFRARMDHEIAKGIDKPRHFATSEN